MAHRPNATDTIVYEYNRIAKELGAIVAPCGVAWKCYFEMNQNKELHISDRSHPNGAGVYLNACVFYRTIFGKIPTKKLFLYKEMGGENARENALKMQAAANEAFQRNMNYGGNVHSKK